MPKATSSNSKKILKALGQSRKPVSKNGRRGRKSWVFGTKISFMEKLRPSYMLAKEAGPEAVGLWARSAATRFKLAYGELPLTEDLEEEPEMPDDEDVASWQEGFSEGCKSLSSEEAAESIKALDAFRTKVMQWAYQHFGVAVNGPTANPVALAVTTAIAKSRERRPQYQQPERVYEVLYWTDRHQEDYRRSYAAFCLEHGPKYKAELDQRVRDDAASDEEPMLSDYPSDDDWPAYEKYIPSRERKSQGLKLRREITSKAWADAPDDIRQHVMSQRQQLFDNALEAYESQVDATTGERTLSADDVLRQGAVPMQTIVDTLAREAGVSCHMIIIGRFGTEGRLQVKSVHGGPTADGLMWNQYDRVGFGNVVESALRYGERLFGSSTTTAPPAQESPSGSSPPSPNPPPKRKRRQSKKAGTRKRQRARDSDEDSANDSNDSLDLNDDSESEDDDDLPLKLVTQSRRAQLRRQAQASASRPTTDPLPRPSSNSAAEPTAGEEPTGGQEPPTGEEPTAGGDHEQPSVQNEPAPSPTPPPGHPSAPICPPDPAAVQKEVMRGLSTPTAQTLSLPPTPRPTEPPTGPSIPGFVRNSVPPEDLEFDWVVDDEWPVELKKAFDGLQRGREWGVAWKSLVHSLLVLERAHGFPAAGDDIPIPASSRPAAFTHFNKWRGKWTRIYGITKDGKRCNTALVACRDEWWTWYKSTVLVEGRKNGDTVIQDPDIEWGSMLDYRGAAGFLRVVGSLLWWGDAVHDDSYKPTPTDLLDWHLAVEEVGWTLDTLIPRIRKRRQPKDIDSGRELRAR
ncbi:hypothetical protein CYLTODRAFT_460077 [Cylindrobasidium torrendii FP15055 ss-10]|uniref:Uncharacterized protein n=1 Tax=Cylindrobasidium torrendii FP15055 ss-10 TaxID=1314674 RepID=A0A0D7AT65_9AGAR|nr:hypothetical protein CYLTODRAFT_460077 [Cylindrobasidium torrendii FP15055 ss-10]